ncbi:hypothetical protein Tco_0151389 [Tanacetum coccineum]
MDALALTPCYSAFLTTVDVPEVYMHQFWDSIHKNDTSYRFRMDKKKKFSLNLETFIDIFQICPRVHGQDFDELPTDDVIVSFFKELGHTREIKSITDVVVDQMHQPWRTFATIINKSLSGKTSGLDKLCLSRAQILWEMYYKKNVDYVELLWEDFTYQIDNRVSKKNKIGMHTSRDDYLINTLRFVFANEESRIYGARLPESMTSPEMRETKAYKTYLGYATGVTPPKKARKFKKPASPKLTTVLDSPKEPSRKSKRVKRPAKKSTNAPTVGVVIRDTHVMSLSKKKEKMNVEKRKGIKLLSEVALTEETQYKEVHKKSLRDFHKTHPSGSGIVTKIAPSATKIKPSVINKGTDDSNNDHDSSTESSDQESDSGDDNTQSDKEKGLNSEHETNENETDETNVESKVKDNAEGDEDKGIDYTTNQFDDDVDVRLNKPVNADEGFIQKEGTDAEMINVQQGNENLEITLNQSPALEKEVVELKKDDLLNTQVTDLILPKEVSNFAPPMIKSMVTESLEHAVLAKESSQPQECYDGLIKSYDLDKSLFFTYDKMYSLKRTQKDKDKDEDPSAGSHRGLRKTSKDVEPTKEEPEFKVADSDMPQDEEENLGNDDEEPKRKVASKHDWFTKPKQPQEPRLAFKLLKGIRTNFAELEYDFEECYKALSEKLDWDNPEGGDYPFDLTKPLPLVLNRNHQMVLVDYFFNNDLKYLQGGITTMTYTTSTIKTKAAQLMHSNELYKFSDGTLTRLQTSLDDITKNIQMEYLSQRRWSSLEKKRAHIMIKAIDKQLKERRMMRSLEKFVGGRHYGTDL